MIQLQIEFTRSRKKDYISSKDIAHVRQQYRTRFGLQNLAGNYSMTTDLPRQIGFVDV